jgi:sodium/hydrogen exchanger 8
MYATLSQNYEDNNGYIPPTYEEGSSSGGGLRMKLKEFHKRYCCHVMCFHYLTLITTQTTADRLNDNTAQHRSPPLTRTI